MRGVRQVGAAAVMAAGFAGTMLVAAPAAFAATPVPVSYEVSQQASVTANSNGGGYTKGFQEGYKAGFADGKAACGDHKHGAQHHITSREQGFEDGYRRGYQRGQDFCGA